MKYIIIFLLFFLNTINIFSQIDEDSNWPNQNWVISSNNDNEYDDAFLLENPTTSNNWQCGNFAGNSGLYQAIGISSPVIDISTNDNKLVVTAEYVYSEPYIESSPLKLEWYDSSTHLWNYWDSIQPNSTNLDYLTCANQRTFTSIPLLISGFSIVQKMGFKYRLVYNHQPVLGFCISSTNLQSHDNTYCYSSVTALRAYANSSNSIKLTWGSVYLDSADTLSYKVLNSDGFENRYGDITNPDTLDFVIDGIDIREDYTIKFYSSCTSNLITEFDYTAYDRNCRSYKFNNFFLSNDPNGEHLVTFTFIDTDNSSITLNDPDHFIIEYGPFPHDYTNTRTVAFSNITNPVTINIGSLNYSDLDFRIKAVCDDGNEERWLGHYFALNQFKHRVFVECESENSVKITAQSSTSSLLGRVVYLPTGTTFSPCAPYIGNNVEIYIPWHANVEVIIDGLDPDIDYDFYLQPYYSGSGTGCSSFDSISITFDLKECDGFVGDCNDPTDFQISSVEPVSTDPSQPQLQDVNLVWESSGGPYNVEYGFMGYNQGTDAPLGEFIVDTNSITIPIDNYIENRYDFYVMDTCNDNWVGPLTNGCIAPDRDDFTREHYDGDDLTDALTVRWVDNDMPHGSTWTIGYATTLPTTSSPSLNIIEEITINDDGNFTYPGTIVYQNLKIEYNGIGTNNYNISFDVSNLNIPLIENYFYIKHFCVRSNGSTPGTGSPCSDCPGSDWIGPASAIGLLANCLEPTNIDVVSTTDSSITLGWDEMNDPAETTWEIEYGFSGFTQDTGATIIVSENPFTVFNLIPSNDYDFYVRTLCGATNDELGSPSEWVGPYTASTSCSNCTSFIPKENKEYVISAWVKERNDSRTEIANIATNTQIKYLLNDLIHEYNTNLGIADGYINNIISNLLSGEAFSSNLLQIQAHPAIYNFRYNQTLEEFSFQFVQGEHTWSDNLVQNPGAELGTINWEGDIESINNGACNSVPPYTGSSNFAVGGVCSNQGDEGSAFQNISVSEFLVANGNAEVKFGGYLRNFNKNDTPKIYIDFIDSLGDIISSSDYIETTNDNWTYYNANLDIPASTVLIRFQLKGIRNQGTDNDSYFDDLFLKIYSSSFVENVAIQKFDVKKCTGSSFSSLGSDALEPLHYPVDNNYYNILYDCSVSSNSETYDYGENTYATITNIIPLNQQVMSYNNSYIQLTFLDIDGNIVSDFTGLPNRKFRPKNNIIDGWQRIDETFKVPIGTNKIKFELVNDFDNDVYFDDIRVFPKEGNMKSFVYDQITQKLMAELDENNYATYYEYDKEGGLIRVKKETEKGVFTIQETRSGNFKK